MLEQPPFPLCASEASRAVYISNLSPQVTSQSLESYFGFSGTILRSVLQPNEHTQGGYLHSIIVFQDESSVTNSLSLHGSLLGQSPVTVSRVVDIFDCSSLDDHSPSAPSIDDSVTTPTSNTTSSLGSFVGKALFTAKKGIDVAATQVKTFDQKVGVSRKVKQFDQEHGVSSSAKQFADHTSKATKSAVNSVDTKFNISSRVKSTVSGFKSKAMSNDAIKKGVTTTRTTLGSFVDGVKSGYNGGEVVEAEQPEEDSNEETIYPSVD
ncbi:hypothetical protein P9112_007942 [Eukaryota sp. TZLM1-RC]